jgi:hypothetical protein
LPCGPIRIGDLVAHALGRRRVDVGDHHPHALGCEPEGDAAPDAASPADHDGDPAAEILHAPLRSLGRASDNP